MSVFNAMKINASGLSLERLKMDIISTNMANVNTTRTPEGGPYRRKEVLFEESLLEARNSIGGAVENKSFGVRVTEIREDLDNQQFKYDPNHPDADENGYVETSNVNMVDEVISLLNTQRTYEANITALNSNKNILKKALEISKG
ncbi:MAG: flagellar basal body rod protein FlgC [Tissierella sp.]|nr:flagellar basal body rod protein FlgC [Tissierella sp.]